MVRWVIIVTASALVIVFTACTGMGIETHPVSSTPTETKMAELPSDPPARLSGTKTISAQNPQFTGNNTFTEVDNNGDGLFEALLVNVEVQSSAPGEYSIFGVLQKGGADIANRPAFESMMFTTATFANGSATHNIDIAFSGEQIFRSSQDGPYDLVLFGVGPSNESAQATFSTPAIVHTKYGEVPAVLTAATYSAIDINDDGDFDFVNLAVDINVRVAENFRLQGDLSKNNASIVGAGGVFDLGSGTHTVDLQFPGSALRQSGEDGPYDGTVNLIDATGHTLQSITFVTQAYESDTFSAQFDSDGNFNN